MAENKDVTGLLKSSIITNKKGWFYGESDYERNSKQLTFYYIVYDIGEDAVKPLISLLKDSDPKIRLRAIKALKEIGERIIESSQIKFCEEYKEILDFLYYLQDIESNLYGLQDAAREVWSNLTCGGDEQAFERLINLLKNFESNYYEKVLEAQKKIETGIKKYDRPFIKTRDALSILKYDIDGKVHAASQDAVRHYNFAPIYVLNKIYWEPYENDNSYNLAHEIAKELKKELKSDEIKHRESLSELNRRLNKKVIDENDEYMDDILIEIYGSS